MATVMCIMGACDRGELSFKAQDAVVTPGVRYVLTVESLDSTHTEAKVTDCSEIPGMTVEIKWRRARSCRSCLCPQR